MIFFYYFSTKKLVNEAYFYSQKNKLKKDHYLELTKIFMQINSITNNLVN